MIKTLRAVAAAMLLVTGFTAAQAATVEPPVGGFVAGVQNEIRFSSGVLAAPTWPYNDPALGLTRALMRINGGPAIYSYIEGIVTNNTVFTFLWNAPTVLPDVLSIEVTLRRYRNAYLTPENEFSQGGEAGGMQFRIVNGQPDYTYDQPIAPTSPFAATMRTSLLQLDNGPDPEMTPVPLVGTLPLMLSALGLGVFVMRRRAKAALA